MWPLVLQFAMQIVPVIPSLVTDVENLFRGKKKAGAAKWIAVEQVLGPQIQELAESLAAAAPPGTKVEKISAEVSKYSKAINDATVALANGLGVFPSGNVASLPATPPAK